MKRKTKRYAGSQFTPAMIAGPASALSGGWRMRVALAQALFQEPDVVSLPTINDSLPRRLSGLLRNPLTSSRPTPLSPALSAAAG